MEKWETYCVALNVTLSLLLRLQMDYQQDTFLDFPMTAGFSYLKLLTFCRRPKWQSATLKLNLEQLTQIS